jgi:septation ring formation regulator EzrA
MTIEKELIASSGILGFLGVVFGLVYRGQNKQIAIIREDVGECVTDKQSLERFKHVTDRMDDFKEDISKLYTISTEHGKSLASIDTNIAHINGALQSIVRKSEERRKGDQ